MHRLLVLMVPLLALLGPACGREGGVSVRWDSETTAVEVADDASTDGAPPIATVVYVTNEGPAVLRDASVRLRDEGAELALGLSLGTVTSVSTEFDGQTRVWRLGDLEPGKRYALPIGLWFSTRYVDASPEDLALTVELVSPDLAAPIRSNVLALRLARAASK